MARLLGENSESAMKHQETFLLDAYLNSNMRNELDKSLEGDLNPRPTAYKAVALAS